MRRRWYINKRKMKILAIIFGIPAIIATVFLIIRGLSMLETWAVILIVIAIVLTILIPIIIKIVNIVKRKKYLNEKRKQLNQEWLTKSAQNIYNIEENTISRPYNTPKYEKKSIMTACEFDFWRRLTLLVGDKYIITPQVPLSSVVKKISDNQYANELYRTIDFGLFTKDTYELIALIELNDRSHLKFNRMERDEKVKTILTEAGIINKLITFWTDGNNTNDYIISCIKKVTT